MIFQFALNSCFNNEQRGRAVCVTTKNMSFDANHKEMDENAVEAVKQRFNKMNMFWGVVQSLQLFLLMFCIWFFGFFLPFLTIMHFCCNDDPYKDDGDREAQVETK